jgi:hypothetical protein
VTGDHPRRSHYEVLGVTPTADEVTLRRAYVSLARQHHPDRAGGDAARMRALNEAWATLGDPVRRARYDRAIALGDPGPAAANPPPDRSWAGPDLDDLDLDDRPVHGPVRLPRWLSLLPAGLFATSVVAFVVGLVLSSEAVVALALMAFVLSCLFFLAAPFVALYASRGGTRGHWGHRGPRR